MQGGVTGRAEMMLIGKASCMPCPVLRNACIGFCDQYSVTQSYLWLSGGLKGEIKERTFYSH